LGEEAGTAKLGDASSETVISDWEGRRRSDDGLNEQIKRE
jgi:hypothetical protein